MGVSSDAPYLDMAYKMVEYNGNPVLKLSPGKMTLPSPKQVFRFNSSAGKLEKDMIGLRDEALEEGVPLLEKVMQGGRVISSSPPLSKIQEIFLGEFSKLDDKLKGPQGDGPFFPVDLSPRLIRLKADVVQRVRQKELGRELE
jgi:nicotinate phosphoribosyltransferase